MSDFPHLKERLEALVQRDVGLVRRLWEKFRTWPYERLKAALDISREDLSAGIKFLAFYDKELEEQGIEAVEISVPDSPISARRIDVPAPLLNSGDFNEINWEYDVPGTLAWQWKWMERKIRTEDDKSNAVRKNQVLRRMLMQIEEYGFVSDEPDSDLGTGFIFDLKEEKSEQSTTNESDKTPPNLSADFVERLKDVVEILEKDVAFEVTSWAKAHGKIEIMDEPPDWVKMITSGGLKKSIHDGIKELKHWSSWPEEYKGLKRTRPLLIEVWNEYREKWEKD